MKKEEKAKEEDDEKEYPEPVTYPVDPPTVDGTEITEDVDSAWG